MDDKTRIRLLKILVTAGLAGTYFNLYIITKQHGTIRELCRLIDHKDEIIDDANIYIHKIVDVTEPLPEQIRQINEEFDLEKWNASLKKD